eukprot:TRINITY_DN7667_c0_g1_i1.p1 TRINITY_DN7667_c0_g1~~TRINITY_DN7667_c0_g1_i1.p1  ORF type:complete len:854 (-),score=201.86 TRINITY_DN7667_c0_g1_i1:109-2670(-)
MATPEEQRPKRRRLRPLLKPGESYEVSWAAVEQAALTAAAVAAAATPSREAAGDSKELRESTDKRHRDEQLRPTTDTTTQTPAPKSKRDLRAEAEATVKTEATTRCAPPAELQPQPQSTPSETKPKGKAKAKGKARSKEDSEQQPKAKAKSKAKAKPAPKSVEIDVTQEPASRKEERRVEDLEQASSKAVYPEAAPMANSREQHDEHPAAVTTSRGTAPGDAPVKEAGCCSLQEDDPKPTAKPSEPIQPSEPSRVAPAAVGAETAEAPRVAGSTPEAVEARESLQGPKGAPQIFGPELIPRELQVPRTATQPAPEPAPEPAAAAPAEQSPVAADPGPVAASEQPAIESAEVRVQAALSQQVASCRRLRAALEDQLRTLQGRWANQQPPPKGASRVQEVLEPAMGVRGETADAAGLTSAVHQAVSFGLPVSDLVYQRLDRLCLEEELEGIWQCLASSLKDADRLSLAFWCEEAEQQGLKVPPEVEGAMAALRSEEAARLAKWESEASFGSLAAEAHARGDVGALRRLAEEAKSRGCDPSAALAALAELTGEMQIEEGAPSEAAGAAVKSSSRAGLPQASSLQFDESEEEEELERLYVSSPNGQSHCFGMYVLVREEKGNGFPVWRQLGGERWLYSDQMGRWTVGSSKVRESNFQCSAGFICHQSQHNGAMPHEMKAGWCRWCDEKNRWRKDDCITVASEYVEEVLAPPRRSARGKAAAKRRSARGRGSSAKGAGRRPPAPGRAAQPAPRAYRAPPPAPKAPPVEPPPASALSLPQGGSMTRSKALKVLGFAPAQRVTSEDLRKRYRQQALRWHPDKKKNHERKEEASQKFVELRAAFEFMQGCLQPLSLLQAAV